MFPLPHMLIGAAVGQAAGSPGLGLALGVASHYLLDAIPHDDRREVGHNPHPAPLLSGRNLRAAGELGVGALLIGALLLRCPGAHTVAVAAAVLGALLPDLIDFPLMAWRRVQVVHPQALHARVGPRHALLGNLTQLVAAVVGLGWLALGLSCF
ncbi:MAG: hypothetical protein QN122_11725 [Armatimonadota bacterium]|nr:hypothetical protein [Armatimonadota bacterium]MDR7449167.1 hypothetical protein [Armatimonadota bacterium]MDR7460630.1 hypothetical protein [Armatimonadota bacterium]MDR7480802.1 hypothetical protein [Armatimonadota bacterium]MDR7489780.1 hypothetical protein [Armatimonadota bacterium]